MFSKSLLAPSFAAYWFIFWFLNGLDKFFFNTSLGVIVWHGKDRTEQFERYFSNIGFPNAPINELFLCTGIVEILISVPFLICGPLLLSNALTTWGRGAKIMQIGLAGSFVVFLGFIILDIIAGDRAELLEHSTYLAVIAASYAVTFLDFFLMREFISTKE